MNIQLVLIGAGVCAAIGLVLGLALAVADRVFKVEVDEREERVLGLLPGINCGACGFPGCAGLAQALCSGQQKEINCKPLKPEMRPKIQEVLDGK